MGRELGSSLEDGRTGRSIATFRRWKYILDEAFRIPGTKFRFGWDPVIGLIPGLGDSITALASVFLLIQSFRLGIPNVIKARMILNVLIDVIVGAIPLIGDIFDFAWKSTSMNLSLLEKHASTGAKPGMADWAFVAATGAAGLMIIAIPILLLFWVLHTLIAWVQGPPIWKM
jgi:hypothetical protein